MTYTSPLTTPVFDSDHVAALDSPRTDEFGASLSCGYQARETSADPDNPAPFCNAYPRERIIPRGEWRDRIESREKTNSTLKGLSLARGIKTVSQNGTNHCWAYGSVRAVEIVEAASGQTHVPLSPTAVACRAVNFRNKGGNTFDAIPVMAEHGIPTAEAWPLNRLDRRYDTSEAWRAGGEFKLLKWWELPSNSFDAMASELLRGNPVIIGVMWWGHMICATDLRALPNGKFGVEIWNSHGTRYGDSGFAVLSERKGTAFDQACPYLTDA